MIVISRKTQTRAIIAIAVVIILILSGVLAVYVINLEEEPEEKEEEAEKEVDNRISPLSTQAVFLNIHRIRRKGIIDQIEDSGSRLANIMPRYSLAWSFLDGMLPAKRGWDKPPNFNYIAVLDGFEYKGAKEFNTWDTDYMNREFFRKVEAEQEKTDISITFIEKEKRLLGTTEKEIESFTVTYDFRHGTWDGDDYFDDVDGYGHYDGANYEMWFSIRQTDNDADGIPYWVEINILGTDPNIDDSRYDPDNDSIPTTWEWKWGYDPLTFNNHSVLDPDNDGLQNTEEYFMEKWLANPFYPDIYIEADYMEKAPFRPYKIAIAPGRIIPIPRPRIVKTQLDGVDHIFYEGSQQMLMERFNEHDITVHIDDGIMGGGGDLLPFHPDKISQDDGTASEFYSNYFAEERQGIFRYLFVNHWGGWCHPQDYKHYYDTIAVPSAREFFLKYLGGAVTKRARVIGRAVQVMHELGHSCGLRPEEWRGIDNMTYGGTTWANYISCMNYNYFGLRFFDYSDGSRGGQYDRNDWDVLDVSYFQRSAKIMEGLMNY